MFQPHLGENKLFFNQMVMRFDFHNTNTCCILQYQLTETTLRLDMSLHIILMPSQPVFALSL